MDKNHLKVEFLVGNTVEDAVKKLLNYKERGKLVCGEFNGITLYSDTVTMDSAYKEITGKTKSEFDKAQQESREKYNREEQEHKDAIPDLSKVWIEKGRAVLTEDRWEYWDKVVPIRLDDLYQGMELGCCLDIVDILNNEGSLDQAKEKIESQDHSGMSFGLVCSMVREFSDRGKDFVDYVR